MFRLFSGREDMVGLMAEATMSVVRQLKKPLRHVQQQPPPTTPTTKTTNSNTFTAALPVSFVRCVNFVVRSLCRLLVKIG